MESFSSDCALGWKKVHNLQELMRALDVIFLLLSFLLDDSLKGGKCLIWLGFYNLWLYIQKSSSIEEENVWRIYNSNK